ncbi:VanZ family protein [Ornithobacterium rhinotracheale]|uniref:VanZ family protein n=1 Tax=Ornithobacterium rhinotracheale TaxID=28251 RepID=UPI00129CAADD|nr:VanZ family protein [Ornithobacterium rhinotracheale]MRJ07632.1 VanZ family protein [Ornithobacterium rhinotracheale]MRJ10258.1 VanZ family protein [Ornithobacterium rhinotracheale]UOH78230.1 VanZ family protein [Ornithobacterium rhinotracheale]
MPKLTKKSQTNLSKVYKVVFALYLVGLLYLTLSPVDEIRPSFLEDYLFPGVDKVVHAGLFTTFSILFYLAFKKEGWCNLGLVAAVGILIEILQDTLPTGRSFEWNDWWFDILGGVVGLVLIKIYQKLRAKN